MSYITSALAMASNIKLFLMFIGIIQCEGVSWRRQLEHIAKTRLENEGIFNPSPSRRFYQFDPREVSSIVGLPSKASHLPEAEPILPGHTLLRPALGMLKSALKFPHRELEDGAGVYGNVDNLGLKYDSRNERLLYSGFRRSPSDYIMIQNGVRSSGFGQTGGGKKRNSKDIKEVEHPLTQRKNLGRSSRNDSSYYILDENTPRHVFDNANEESLRTNQKVSEKPNKGPTASNSVEETHTPEKNYIHREERNKKKESWLNAMDTFDHIQIVQEAPEINELVPTAGDDDIRKWWFYNADDYQPFSRERH